MVYIWYVTYTMYVSYMLATHRYIKFLPPSLTARSDMLGAVQSTMSKEEPKQTLTFLKLFALQHQCEQY